MPQQEPGFAALPASRDSMARALIGRVLGDFELRREIGRGGMGTVFEAWQRSLHRVVAVKVLANSQGLAPMAIERFQREAQAAAKLHHTNIVPIYAQGEHDGLYYYAMERIHGKSVFEIIEDIRSSNAETQHYEPAPHSASSANAETIEMSATAAIRVQSGGSSYFNPEDQQALTDSALAVSTPEYFDNVARLVSTVAAALQYAHDAGVIHRDIKPHNLILGNDGRLCISDFGLARMLEQPGMTMTGEFMGSPLYMSPEQIASGSMRVDHRTDIYSLGATVYEWLTLRPPFPAQSREQVISMIMTVEATPPTTYNPRVPTDLETICLKAIEKNPSDRYQSAGDMADDLRRFLERDRIRARRASIVVRTRKLVNRHPVAVMLAAMAVVIAAASGVFFNQQNKLRQTQQLLIGAQANNGAANPAPVPATVPVKTTPEPPVTAASNANAITFDLGKQLAQALRGDKGEAGAPEVSFGVQLEQFQLYVADRFADAHLRQHLEAVAFQLQMTPNPGHGPDSAVAAYMESAIAKLPQDALSLVQVALARDPQHLASMELRATLLCKLQRFDEMLAAAEELVQAHPSEPKSNLLLGAAHLFRGDVEAAQPDLAEAEAAGLQSAWLHALTGLSHAHQGRFDLAAQEYNRALKIDTAHVVSLFGRGTTQYYQGSYDWALQDAEKVVELEPASYEAFEFRADCYMRQRRYADASADYFKALSLGGPQGALLLKVGWATTSKREADAEVDDDNEPQLSDVKDAGTTAPNQQPADINVTSEQIKEYLRNPTGGQKGPKQPTNPAPGSHQWP